ncbi:cellulose binding domain-containing protein [Micromonospora purpureochromogenes]|uniref:cellulose binding domain-containing protein n=1 Tax=Micromonospora purpureochromogenes TaxID=47872 RepID=UPI0033F90B0E
MIEISAQVDLSHPSDRVWQALTNPQLLSRWFTETEKVTQAPQRLLLHTAGLPGFHAAVDAEVTDQRAPELLVLQCQEGDRRTRLTCTITRTADGCRLSVEETMEHGTWPAEDRDHRERYYQQTLTGRLPAILDWLAFQQVDLRRGEDPPTAELPAIALSGGAPAPTGRRRRLAIVAAVTAATLATGAALWALLPNDADQTAAPAPLPPPPTAGATGDNAAPRTTRSSRPSSAAARSTPRPSRTPTATPSRTPTSAAPSAATMTARYETTATRILGYTGRVVLDNPDGPAAKSWTLVVTLAEGATVTNAQGGNWQQDGQDVTFTGAPVPAGQSQTITFDVRNPDPRTKAPEGCTIDGTPCTGL